MGWEKSTPQLSPLSVLVEMLMLIRLDCEYGWLMNKAPSCVEIRLAWQPGEGSADSEGDSEPLAFDG